MFNLSLILILILKSFVNTGPALVKLHHLCNYGVTKFLVQLML